MKTYEVVEGPARFGAGTRMLLTREQASARRHLLEGSLSEKSNYGVFVTTGAVEFKRGEIIGLDGTPPKALREVMKPSDDAEASSRRPRFSRRAGK